MSIDWCWKGSRVKKFEQVMLCLCLLMRGALWDVARRRVGFSKDLLITLSALEIL